MIIIASAITLGDIGLLSCRSARNKCTCNPSSDVWLNIAKYDINTANSWFGKALTCRGIMAAFVEEHFIGDMQLLASVCYETWEF